MTPERLAEIENLIKNPSSASLDKAPLLELVEAVRMLIPLAAVGAASLPSAQDPVATQPIMQVVDEQHFGGAKPTPPAVVIDDRKPKKGKK